MCSQGHNPIQLGQGYALGIRSYSIGDNNRVLKRASGARVIPPTSGSQLVCGLQVSVCTITHCESPRRTRSLEVVFPLDKRENLYQQLKMQEFFIKSHEVQFLYLFTESSSSIVSEPVPGGKAGQRFHIRSLAFSPNHSAAHN